MDSIGSILPKVLKRRGVYPHVVTSLAVAQASQWLLEHLPTYVPALKVKGVRHWALHVLAKDTVSLMALTGQKEAFLAFLQESVPDANIADIRITRN